MIKNKKSVELAINTVVTIIIGLIIFSLGISIFFNFLNLSENKVNDLNNNIKENIAGIKCRGEEDICSSNIEMKLNQQKVSHILISNKFDEKKNFKIEIKGLTNNELKKGCGAVNINYFKESINIESGNSAGIPIEVSTNKVKTTPCQFITTIKLLDKDDNNKEVSKTLLIVSVK